MDNLLRTIKRILPTAIFNALQPVYHYGLAIVGAVIYRFPSRSIKIVGVTGTKGKSSTVEIVDGILRAGGFKTAVAGTVRFSIGEEHESNLFKQTMPGRMYLQHFLRKAVNARCDWVIVEMTSEGSRQFRNRCIYLDALIVTNLQPEHLESHGGFENYKRCKQDIAHYSLTRSPKRPRVIILNVDDPHHQDFMVPVEQTLMFGASLIENFTSSPKGMMFSYNHTIINSPLVGSHNLSNIHSAIRVAEFAGMSHEEIVRGIESIHVIPGRGQSVDMGQPFTVIVDYAHTNDSLEAIYQAYQGESIIGILGACGGGRDRWKRPDFGRIAQQHCKYVVLTNEDPYDEDPMQIITDMESGMDKSTEGSKYIKIFDRREAFHHAFSYARTGDVILITGKGTDPFIMGPNGSRERWSDLETARETLRNLGYSN